MQYKNYKMYNPRLLRYFCHTSTKGVITHHLPIVLLENLRFWQPIILMSQCVSLKIDMRIIIILKIILKAAPLPNRLESEQYLSDIAQIPICSVEDSKARGSLFRHTIVTLIVPTFVLCTIFLCW